MIRVTALYPNKPGSRFDIDYYLNEHVPMVMERLGDACKGFSLDEGLADLTPPGTVTYRVIVHWLFESMEAFLAAFNPQAEAIGEDFPNFTDLEPIIQVGKVRSEIRGQH